jgi:glycosyltransferase involved in cell wall biosynthesis
MHVDWHWIKQRPHFLAEELSKRYDVTVVYPFSRGRSKLKRNPKQGLRTRPVIGIPFKYVFPTLYRLNRFYQRLLIGALVRRFKPEVVWLTHPYCLDLIPRGLDARVVYDCMDDAYALAGGREFARQRALQLERDLVARADAVFVSSSHLATVLETRQPCSEKTTLLRNAFGGRIGVAPPSEANRSGFRIGYVGTIASWMDFEAIAHCIASIPDVEFVLIGPCDGGARVPSHDRLKSVGSVPHAELHEAVKDFDCLIMPFKVNDVVRSVDPVKLYDYINFGKPIISIRYDEVARFEPFVEFYSSKDDLVRVVQRLKDSGFRPKYSAEERESFLLANTWDVRAETVVECLERLV